VKLSPQKAGTYFRSPDDGRVGILIYGPDMMRIALKRQELIKTLVGPNGDEEMRLSRISAAELRKDPAILNDAIKAQSFFPGPRVAFLDDASDSIAPIISNALEDWRDGDAQLVITAGQLRAGSPLRKMFENHPNAYAAAIYADPPSQSDIQLPY
jgi:DNA polymerase-3 subunit delta